MAYRIEHDSMGEMKVDSTRYWGAQTERSRLNFPIGAGRETMPEEIIRAFAVLKKAAALANCRLKPDRMTAEKCGLICRAADEVLSGSLDLGKLIAAGDEEALAALKGIYGVGTKVANCVLLFGLHHLE